MNQFFAIATLIVGGVIVADVLSHPDGVTAGGTALNNTLVTSFTAMLGSIPGAPVAAKKAKK